MTGQGGGHQRGDRGVGAQRWASLWVGGGLRAEAASGASGRRQGTDSPLLCLLEGLGLVPGWPLSPPLSLEGSSRPWDFAGSGRGPLPGRRRATGKPSPRGSRRHRECRVSRPRRGKSSEKVRKPGSRSPSPLARGCCFHGNWPGSPVAKEAAQRAPASP